MTDSDTPLFDINPALESAASAETLVAPEVDLSLPQSGAPSIPLDQSYQSWGRYPHAGHEPMRMFSIDAPLPLPGGTLTDGSLKSLLPYGRGRSYGDSCLNDGQALVPTLRLNKVLDFDRSSGILRCESGVTFGELTEHVLPLGWFPRVMPGSARITVGGAIASNVHGKNQRDAGLMGAAVRSIELMRSDGSRLICSSTENTELFWATIGGLGLTGLITWAELELRRVENPFVELEWSRFKSLDEFFDLSAAADGKWEYASAWIDGLARGKNLGRGILTRGRHAAAFTPDEENRLFKKVKKLPLTIPFDLPEFFLNSLSIQALNAIFYRSHLKPRVEGVRHYSRFFHSLDAVAHWNRAYGARGVLQYQCLLPADGARESIRTVLEWIAESGMASCLGTLKVVDEAKWGGFISETRSGVMLAMDFPNYGSPLLELMERLDAFVLERGGTVNPAVDARMSPENFREFFPRWQEFARQMDPRFSSSFWRRVMGQRLDG